MQYPTAFAKGLKKTMKALIKKTQALYTSDEIPWVIGYSGGKDSTAALQAIVFQLGYYLYADWSLVGFFIIFVSFFVEIGKSLLT